MSSVRISSTSSSPSYEGQRSVDRATPAAEQRDLDGASRLIRQFTVTHRPSTRLHTVMSMTPEGPQTVTFSMTGKDGRPDRTVNICDFYHEFYGCALQAKAALHSGQHPVPFLCDHHLTRGTLLTLGSTALRRSYRWNSFAWRNGIVFPLPSCLRFRQHSKCSHWPRGSSADGSA